MPQDSPQTRLPIWERDCISAWKPLLRICGALDCDISDVIELEREKSSSGEAEDRIKKVENSLLKNSNIPTLKI